MLGLNSVGNVDSTYSQAKSRLDGPTAPMGLHFYSTKFGKIPLLWENVDSLELDGTQVSTVLSRPVSISQTSNLLTNIEYIFIVHNGDTLSGSILNRDVYSKKGQFQYISVNETNFNKLFGIIANLDTGNRGPLLVKLYELTKSTHGYSSFAEFVRQHVLQQTNSTTELDELDDGYMIQFFQAYFELYHTQFWFGSSKTGGHMYIDNILDDFRWLSFVGSSPNRWAKQLAVAQLIAPETSIVEYSGANTESLAEYVSSHVRFEGDELEEFLEVAMQRVHDTSNVVITVNDLDLFVQENKEGFMELVEAVKNNTQAKLVTRSYNIENIPTELLPTGLWVVFKNNSTESEYINNLWEGAYDYINQFEDEEALLLTGESMHSIIDFGSTDKTGLNMFRIR